MQRCSCTHTFSSFPRQETETYPISTAFRLLNYKTEHSLFTSILSDSSLRLQVTVHSLHSLQYFPSIPVHLSPLHYRYQYQPYQSPILIHYHRGNQSPIAKSTGTKAMTSGIDFQVQAYRDAYAASPKTTCCSDELSLVVSRLLSGRQYG